MDANQKADRINAKWREIVPAHWSNLFPDQRSALPEFLADNELPEYVLVGMVGGGGSNEVVVAIATDRQLVAIVKRESIDVTAIGYKDIDSITYDSDAVESRILIKGPTADEFKIDNIFQEESVAPFVNHVRTCSQVMRGDPATIAVNQVPQSQSSAPESPSNESDSKERRINNRFYELAPASWRDRYGAERRKLYELLGAEEDIDRLIAGRYLADTGILHLHNGHNGIAVATSTRVLFVDKNVSGSTKISEIPYRSIKALTYNIGILSASVHIPGRRAAGFRIDNIIEKDSVKPFVDCVQTHVNADPLSLRIARLEFLRFLRAYLATNEARHSPGKARTSLYNEKNSKKQRIDVRWNALKPSPWDNRHSGERQMLYDILDAEEDIERLIGGTFRADTDRYHKHAGVAVATSKRVIFLDKGVFGSTEVYEMPYRSVEAITYSTGMMAAGVQITGRGAASFRIEDIYEKYSVKPFVDCVRTHLETASVQAAAQVVAPAASSADEIEKFAGLLEKGILTHDEFDAKKKQLLGL